MNIKDINFAIEMLSHPQSGDESDINMALDVAIKSLKEQREVLKQKPKWILVTEDVPPKGTVCLWCNKQGNIVAWMPLPKAYKEEGEV